MNDERYLELLAEKYPTEQAVSREIINLTAILSLPKGTEHFMSDLHGEYESFCHILNNCSGVIREKVDLLFGETLSDFLGLRLAMLIRFTKTKNKLTPIIIYGEADCQDMITNECFDILKMPGVYYVHSDYPSLTNVAQFL